MLKKKLPLLITIALLASNAHAFSTAVHDAITLKITQDIGYDSTGYQGLNQGNRYADYWDPNDHGGEGQVPPAHVDAESFVAASARIRGLISKATTALAACDRPGALEALGRMMHPVEDIFSHSNLVEIEQRDGKKYSLDFLNLPAAHEGLVCDPATHMTNFPGLAGLTTGYFRAGDNVWRPEGKCNHYQLNKDYPNAGTDSSGTPKLSNAIHDRAVARAEEEGTKFLRDVAEEQMYSSIEKAVYARESCEDTSTLECLLTFADNVGAKIESEHVAELFISYLHTGGDCPVSDPISL
jgi:hypothetical protein